MCGIIGYIVAEGKADSNLPRALERGREVMSHRGPDSCGAVFLDTSAGVEAEQHDVAFGFRRLAIHDLSTAGNQPMSTGNGKLWIVFNGEVYNFVELRTELEVLGHVFHSGTDTEVVLKSYQEWGRGCVERFNGMWAFAICDMREAGKTQLWISRDRFGVKPLYHAKFNGAIWFASEMKCLFTAGLRPEPNEAVFAQFLGYGIPPLADGGETFFRGVEALPPGHELIIENGMMEQRKWWDIGKPSYKAAR